MRPLPNKEYDGDKLTVAHWKKIENRLANDVCMQNGNALKSGKWGNFHSKSLTKIICFEGEDTVKEYGKSSPSIPPQYHIILWAIDIQQRIKSPQVDFS